jgi:hypothetical protein
LKYQIENRLKQIIIGQKHARTRLKRASRRQNYADIRQISSQLQRPKPSSIKLSPNQTHSKPIQNEITQKLKEKLQKILNFKIFFSKKRGTTKIISKF